MEEVKNEQIVSPVETAEVDERGVPWKNVAMENERKLREISERLAKVEISTSPNYQNAVPQNPSPVIPNSVDPQREIEEFTTNPDRWYQKKREQERIIEQQALMQKKLADARAIIASKGADKYNENYTKVLDMVNKWSIDQSDPVVAVQKAFAILDLESNASMSQREKQLAEETSKKKEAEVIRTNEIKKTQAVGGSKPPISGRKNVDEDYMNAVRDRGDEKSVANFLRNTMFSDDKK